MSNKDWVVMDRVIDFKDSPHSLANEYSNTRESVQRTKNEPFINYVSIKAKDLSGNWYDGGDELLIRFDIKVLREHVTRQQLMETAKGGKMLSSDKIYDLWKRFVEIPVYNTVIKLSCSFKFLKSLLI